MKRRFRKLVGFPRTPRERALDTMPRIRWY